MTALAPVTLFNGWLGRCARCGVSVVHANGELDDVGEVPRHFDCRRAEALAAEVRVQVVLADLERYLRSRPPPRGADEVLSMLHALPDRPDAIAVLDALMAAHARLGGTLRLERAIDGIRFAIRRMGEA